MLNFILNSPLSLFWLVWTIVLLVCCVSCWRMYRWFHHAKLIQNTPTSTVRSAVQGYVELKGIARKLNGPRIIAASGKECVWYKYTAHEVTDDGLSILNTFFQSLFTFTEPNFSGLVGVGMYTVSDDLFVLEDGRDRVIIDPDYADVIPIHKKSWVGRASGIDWGGGMRSGGLEVGSIHYTEYRIDEGDEIFVTGLFETHGHTEANHEKEALTDLLSVWKQDVALMDKFDVNKDGLIDGDEWEAVRKVAKRQLHKDQIQSEKQELLNLVRYSGQKQHPLIISAQPESRLISKYYWRALGRLALFLISGSWLVWALNFRMAM